MNARLGVIKVAGSWIKEQGIFMCGAFVSAHGYVIFSFVLVERGIAICFHTGPVDKCFKKAACFSPFTYMLFVSCF